MVVIYTCILINVTTVESFVNKIKIILFSIPKLVRKCGEDDNAFEMIT